MKWYGLPISHGFTSYAHHFSSWMFELKVRLPRDGRLTSGLTAPDAGGGEEGADGAGFPGAPDERLECGGRFLGFPHMAVAQKRTVPKWVALVSGSMDQHLRNPGCLILRHPHMAVVVKTVVVDPILVG